MPETLPQTFLAHCGRRGGLIALRRKEEGSYRDITWETLGQEVRRYGRAILSRGLARGDRVAIMAPNTPEWVYIDLGTMAAGGTSVPVYHTEGINTLLHILGDSGTRILFVHSPKLAAEISSRRDTFPSLQHIVLLDGKSEDPAVLSLSDFLAGSEDIPAETFERSLETGRAGDVATIVYTSGTTGIPKGVSLTHGTILANLQACARLFPIGEKDVCLSFLPLSHVFERVDGYYFMLNQGVTIAYAESQETVPANLQEVSPTVVISVPRLYEKMYGRVMEQILAAPPLKRKLFFAALAAGRAHARRELAGERPGAPLRLAVALAGKVVFSKLRERLGGRLRFFISGGAPLAQHIAEFFLAAGVPIYEGYGLTETAGGVAVNAPGSHKPGTVGRLFPNIEGRIAPDGEILLRGSGVFSGYWKRPDETREVFEGGWFRTGDIGTIDPGGFLAITDRKKDLLITGSGENIAPQPLENLFKSDPLIANALVLGDRRPYLTALLVPNLENLEKFGRELGIDFASHCDLVTHPKVLEPLRQRIDRLQEGLPPFQRIKRFTLLSKDFSKQALTPTLKVKRKVVIEQFRGVLEGMYSPQDHGFHDSGFCIVEDLTEAEKD